VKLTIFPVSVFQLDPFFLSRNCSTALLNIFDIYNLSQTIAEPTRITNTSQTLIDLCITNNLDKVKASGVLSLGISDHSLVYLIRKCTYHKAPVNAFVEKRNFKNFNERAYLNDLNNLNWEGSFSA
jgi:hypothetical protein